MISGANTRLPDYQTRAAGPPTKEPNKAHGVQQAENLNLKLQLAQKNPLMLWLDWVT
jgi:hypothetical protein